MLINRLWLTVCLIFFLSLLFSSLTASEAVAYPQTLSCYGGESGPNTASGEVFDPSGMTAAHPYLPFGTHLLITYKGKQVVVRVNDRGDFGGRWDLALGACGVVGLDQDGVGVADIQELD